MEDGGFNFTVEQLLKRVYTVHKDAIRGNITDICEFDTPFHVEKSTDGEMLPPFLLLKLFPRYRLCFFNDRFL